MAYGTLLSDVIQSSTAGTAPQFNDGNGTQIGKLARAWVRFNSATSAIAGSFNVSSITKNSTGNNTINFTTAMPATTYALCGTAKTTDNSAITSNGTILMAYSFGTSSVIVTTTDGVGSYVDAVLVNAAIFSA